VAGSRAGGAGPILTTLIENRPLSGGSHLLRIAFDDARAGAPASVPGQFCQLLASPSCHLVRRPMSIHDEGDGWRSFMVKPVGPASRELVRLRSGEPVDASPALGNGFPAELAGCERLLLVGGGFGVAPLHFLARRLDAGAGAAPYTILYGGRTTRDVEMEVLTGVRGRVLPSTDDGTLGFHGTCVELARLELERAGREAAARTTVVACGSHAMMLALHRALHGRAARILVSLEEVMACGVGVCMGCVTPSVRGYVPICTEGPVFASDEVFDVAMGDVHV
jgi:dihydroorotate dehydrogenase electron transfer subunit